MAGAVDSAAVELLVAQAVEQGFPRTVTDPVVLERIAAVVRSSQGGEQRAA